MYVTHWITISSEGSCGIGFQRLRPLRLSSNTMHFTLSSPSIVIHYSPHTRSPHPPTLPSPHPRSPHLTHTYPHHTTQACRARASTHCTQSLCAHAARPLAGPRCSTHAHSHRCRTMQTYIQNNGNPQQYSNNKSGSRRVARAKREGACQVCTRLNIICLSVVVEPFRLIRTSCYIVE